MMQTMPVKYSKQEIDAENTFQKMFDLWWVKENVGNRGVTISISNEPNLNNWRESSPDTQEFVGYIDRYELSEYFKQVWMEEIGITGLEKMDGDDSFIYEESAYLFSFYFDDFAEEKVCQQYEDRKSYVPEREDISW